MAIEEANKTNSYNLYLPINRGDNKSWGYALNYNFCEIDNLLVQLNNKIEQNTQLINNTQTRENTLQEGINENVQNIQNITSLINDNTSLINLAQNEITTARGSKNNINERISILQNNDGTPKINVIFNGIYGIKWNKVTTNIGSNSTHHDIDNVFLSKNESDGTTKGIPINNDYAKFAKILDSNGNIIYGDDGNQIIGLLSKVNLTNTLRVSFYKNKTNETYSFNTTNSDTNYSELTILYPEIDSTDNINIQDATYNDIYVTSGISAASSTKYGLTKYGKGNGSDADMVDGIHANQTPTANQLLPLDADGTYPSNIIRVRDRSNNDSTVSGEFNKIVYAEGSDINKSIDFYIGSNGSRKFPLVKSGDEGSQFTKTISEIEKRTNLTWYDYHYGASSYEFIKKIDNNSAIYRYSYVTTEAYRIVPYTYNPNEDKFYRNFNSETNELTNLLATRGQEGL